jgi:hypothetical protein
MSWSCEKESYREWIILSRRSFRIKFLGGFDGLNG